jgi:alpha-beta hydrolase superfamily lysophospholipase
LIVCPSFGYGNWESPNSVRAVQQAIEHARGHYNCDTSRLYIAGISQGGAGVVRAARELGIGVTGLILISPTMEPKQLTDPWNGMPTLVIQGDADHNVPHRSVERGVELMRNAGGKVTFHLLPGEDHFLFFARRSEVLTMVGEWMR